MFLDPRNIVMTPVDWRVRFKVTLCPLQFAIGVIVHTECKQVRIGLPFFTFVIDWFRFF